MKTNTSSKKLLRMSIVLLSFLTVSWTPFSILLVCSFYVSFATTQPYFKPLTLLACFNSAVNPIVYGLMWRPIRAALAPVSYSHWSYVETNQRGACVQARCLIWSNARASQNNAFTDMLKKSTSCPLLVAVIYTADSNPCTHIACDVCACVCVRVGVCEARVRAVCV